MAGIEESIQRLFERAAIRNIEIIQEPIGTRIDDGDLLLDRKGRVLVLLENFLEPLAAVQL